jgi:hypothetical protein
MHEAAAVKRWASGVIAAVLAGSIADRLGVTAATVPMFILVLGGLLCVPLLMVAAWSEGR